MIRSSFNPSPPQPKTHTRKIKGAQQDKDNKFYYLGSKISPRISSSLSIKLTKFESPFTWALKGPNNEAAQPFPPSSTVRIKDVAIY